VLVHEFIGLDGVIRAAVDPGSAFRRMLRRLDPDGNAVTGVVTVCEEVTPRAPFAPRCGAACASCWHR